MATRMNLSFAGCGFLGIYHIGVSSCIKSYAPQLAEGCIAGASAGAIAAACLLSDVDLGEGTNYVLRIATRARTRALGPLHPTFNISQLVAEGLLEMIPDNAYKVCNGRLFVSLTRLIDRQNVIVSEFNSQEELIQALMCSAHVPFYSGLIPPAYRGVRYFDGGLSDNIPTIDEDTITISPFAGESDICPDDRSGSFVHFNMNNTSIQCTARNLYRLARALFPPHPEILSEMCRQGFDDTLRFLQENNLITCVKHISIVSIIDSRQALDTIEDDSDTSSTASDESWSSDEECGDCDDCRDCKYKQQLALLDTLPPAVIQALQTACKKNSFLTRIYNTRVYQALALAFTPCVLPLDIAFNFTFRFLKYIPYLAEDGQWLLREFPNFMGAVVHRLQYLQRRRYSAKFSCSMNIREVIFKRRTSHLRNLNLNFAVEFLSSAKTPVDCLHQLEHQLVEERHAGHDADLSASIEDLREDDRIAISPKPVYESTAADVFDTFETYLESAEEMETVMAFYYRDEFDRVNVTEIRATKPEPMADFQTRGRKKGVCIPNTIDTAGSTPSELAWDNYQELQNEDVNLVDFEDVDIVL